MPKDYLGKRGYCIYKNNYNEDKIQYIRDKLTVKPFSSYNNNTNAFPVYSESPNKLYIPRYWGLKNLSKDSLDFKLPSPLNISINFAKSLKPKQQPIVEAFMNSLNENYGGGIISVPCGYGKTVLALYIAAQLGVKTLVIVHKEFLLNQWKERIEEFIPDANIGRIQSTTIKTKNKDIVLGMLQSISMIEYDQEIFSDFGLVIYDECHHLGAEVFSKALLKTPCKYTLGLSATPKRSDGLSKVFEWFLGEIVYLIKKRDDNNVNVKLIDYYDNDAKYSKEIMTYTKKPNFSSMINNICAFEPRLNLIINEINICLEEGRKVLVLSDRREHLKSIKDILDTNENYSAGYYLGGMKQSELEETEVKNVILGTFAMASEGFDCREPLDTIILASPKSNIEQAVGRILRQEEKDRVRVPLVIDIIDCFSIFKKQGEKRVKFYKKNSYNIDLYNFNDGECQKVFNYYVNKPKKVCDLEFLPD